MRTRYGQSPWIAGVPSSRRPSSPRLRGDHTTPLAIVGGGLTGCATAYACAAAGLPVTLIEAGRLGQQRTGHGTGLLLPDPDAAFRDVNERHGLRASRLAFEIWRRAALDAASLLRRLGFRAKLDALDSISVAAAGSDRTLRRDYEARRSAGLPVSWLNAGQLRAETGVDGAGLRRHDAFGVNPYRVCLALATAAVRRGARVFEQSEVRRIRVGPRDLDIVCAGGTVRAGRVIVATGSATDLFAPLRRHFTARETYLTLTEPMPAPMRRAVHHPAITLEQCGDPRRRVRWLRDGRVLVAGADQDAPPDRGRDALLVQRTGQLMYELLTTYPAISGLAPAFGWSRPYARTDDGLPFIGPHRNYPRHLFAFDGESHSLTGAFLAARILLRAVRGEPDKADVVFGFRW